MCLQDSDSQAQFSKKVFFVKTRAHKLNPKKHNFDFGTVLKLVTTPVCQTNYTWKEIGPRRSENLKGIANILYDKTSCIHAGHYTYKWLLFTNNFDQEGRRAMKKVDFTPFGVFTVASSACGGKPPNSEERSSKEFERNDQIAKLNWLYRNSFVVCILSVGWITCFLDKFNQETCQSKKHVNIYHRESSRLV